MPIQIEIQEKTRQITRDYQNSTCRHRGGTKYKPQTRQPKRMMSWGTTHQNEHKSRHNCQRKKTEKRGPKVWVFHISASSQPLPRHQKQPVVLEMQTGNALISRSHVPITMAPGTVIGRRCHLSSFFRLPPFQMERKAKTPKAGGAEERVGCGCETDGRVNERFLIELKIDHLTT